MTTAQHPQSLEQSFELDEERPFPSQSARARSPRQPGPEDEYEHAPPPRSYVGIIKLIVMACIIGIVAAIFFWQWPNMKRMVASVRGATAGPDDAGAGAVRAKIFRPGPAGANARTGGQ